MKYLIVALLAINFIACSKNEEGQLSSFLNCNDLSENYEIYNGVKTTCQYYYALTEYDNQQFIELVTPCDNYSRAFVFNEMCEDICATLPHDENSECGKYLQNREVLDILFVKKQ